MKRTTIAVVLSALFSLTPLMSATLSICYANKETTSQAVEVSSQVVEPVPEEEVSIPEPEEDPKPVLFDVPLSEDLQLHIIHLCEEYHIDPAIILAMIERESRFQSGVIGDNGNSFGLLQIQARWHGARMDKLGVTDLLDPYQNVAVGIDYLAELLGEYEDLEMALVAYNAGPTGAYNGWFSKGIYSSNYSETVVKTAEKLKGEQ